MIQNAPDQATNTVSFLWEPLKEVGLYAKVGFNVQWKCTTLYLYCGILSEKFGWKLKLIYLNDRILHQAINKQ